MERKHIVKSYDTDLEMLRSKIEKMGIEANSQLQKAVRALTKRDSHLAQDTIQGDTAVNVLQEEIDLLTVRLLATRQPMAIDLRHIISGLKIAADLERIADYAANIAKHVIDLNSISLNKPIKSIIAMTEVAQSMLDEVMDAYMQTDADKAIEVWHRDNEINQIYGELLGQLRSYMEEDTDHIKAYTSLLLVARCCERIGDHITNVAESVYYIESGQMQFTPK
jgi:phosphate transport system protein